MTQDQAIEELKKFKELLDINAITQEEFEAKKAELMPSMMAKKTDNVTMENPIVSQQYAKLKEKEVDPSKGCLIYGIILATIFVLGIIVSGLDSKSSSRGSSNVRTEYSYSDVKVRSQRDFEKRIKTVLRDPDSYQCVEYDVRYVSGDNYKATLTFRARNGFGGMNICTYQGDLIWKEGSSSYSLGHITEIE